MGPLSAMRRLIHASTFYTGTEDPTSERAIDDDTGDVRIPE